MFPAKKLGPGPCPFFISPCGRLTKRVLSTAAGPTTALGSRQTHQIYAHVVNSAVCAQTACGVLLHSSLYVSSIKVNDTNSAE